MLTEGIHDIPLSEYVRDPAPVPSLSASVATKMVSLSPRHAFNAHPRLNPNYKHEDGKKQDIGTAGHAILLEQDRSKIVVVDAKDWRTDKAKDARDEAYAANLTPILATQMPEIEAMVAAAMEAVNRTELADVFTKDGGDSERTMLWQEDGTWLRCRPDRMSRDRRIIVDLKFTGVSAEPNNFVKQMVAMGYDIQAAMNLRGAMALVGPYDCTFVDMVVETEPPYMTSFIGFSPSFLTFAHEKLGKAIAMWRECMASKQWPGYPDRIAYVEPPSYALTQWGERVYGL